MSSVAIAVVLLLLLSSSFNYLPQGRALVEGWRNGEDRPQQKQEEASQLTIEGIEQEEGTPPTTVILDSAQQSTVKSQTATQPKNAATGAEPSPTNPSKIVVMGRMSAEDTDWVHTELPDWQTAIYTVDLPPNTTSPTGLRTRLNKGKEGNPYLTYIIDHYPDFPDIIAFIHAHRNGFPLAWHTDQKNHDAVTMLHDLRLQHVLDQGYANLRCEAFPGCPNEIQPWRDPPIEDKLPERLYPYVYSEMFQVPLHELRRKIETVGTACCAQFAVSKAQILQRPKTDYVRFRDYLEATTFEDDVIGRVYEYMWHIMFGREAVHCPDARTCRCKVFGHCTKTFNWRGSGAKSGGRG